MLKYQMSYIFLFNNISKNPVESVFYAVVRLTTKKNCKLGKILRGHVSPHPPHLETLAIPRARLTAGQP